MWVLLVGIVVTVGGAEIVSFRPNLFCRASLRCSCRSSHLVRMGVQKRNRTYSKAMKTEIAAIEIPALRAFCGS